jgi:hypothetical protein|tara:strand:+ start:2395 stop:2760 length:366 start_codon:yes stop_codon:yes gene_type:complete
MTRFEITRETKKALQLAAEGVTFWVQRRWMRDDGTLTAKGQEAFDAAKNGEKKTGKPYLKCKFRDLRDVSEKAVVVDCFDGSSDILPKSQIRCGVDSVLVPCWLAEQKNLQFATTKIWLED